MRISQKISLKNKLIGVILLGSVLALGSGFTLVVLYQIRNLKAKFIQDVHTDALLIAKYCTTSLAAKNTEGTESALAKLQTIPYITDGIVFSPDKEPIAIYNRSDEAFAPPYPEQEVLSAYLDGFFHLVHPITLGDQAYGKLYLRASTADLDQRVVFFVMTMLALLIVLMVVTYFLALLLQRIISKPVLSLMRATKRIAGQHESSLRTKQKVRDEISILQDRFSNFFRSPQAPEADAASAQAGVAGGAETEGTLAKTDDKYRELIENMHSAAVVFEAVNDGEDFIIKVFNKAGEMMEHIHRDDLIGKRVTEVFPGVKGHGLLEAFQRVWKSGNKEHHPYSRYRDDQDAGWRENFIYKLSSGEIAAIYSDITEQVLAKEKQAQAREKGAGEPQKVEETAKREVPSGDVEDASLLVAEKTAQLGSMNKELEAIFYAVANDLRVPLETIDEFSKSFLEDYAGNLDDQGKNYLIQIRAASHRMGQLFKDITQLSMREFKLEQVDLSTLARRKALELKEGNPDRKVEFNIQEGLTAWGDAQLLNQVMDHLLTNAWLYTARKSMTKIEFGTEEKEDQILFYVKDNGTGFDMANSEKMFMPFQRLHADEVYPGAGMGLAIVRRIIHMHGGIIWAEGRPEEGATFYFSIAPHRKGNL